MSREDGWFFTFGFGHKTADGRSLASCYIVVPDPDWGRARMEMARMRGTVWAFQYPMSELQGQVDQFGLREVTEEEL